MYSRIPIRFARTTARDDSHADRYADRELLRESPTHRELLPESHTELLRDFQNYKRHSEAQLQSCRERAQHELLAELAPVVHALEAAQRSADIDPQAVRAGVELVSRNLQKVFDVHGLERIATAGEPFDPELHEAVLMERVEGVVSGTVVRELSPGFRTHSEVIRPARVSVAQ